LTYEIDAHEASQADKLENRMNYGLRMGVSLLTLGMLTLPIASAVAQNTTHINPENGNLYIYNPTPMTWEQAQSWAESIDGHLATINSESEQNWINTTFAGMPDSWIGLTQAPGSDEPGAGWEWVTGEPLDYTFWNLVAPSPDNSDSNGDENCGVSYIESDNGHWDDKRCERNFPSIAEIPAPARLYTFNPTDVYHPNSMQSYEILNSSVGVQSYCYQIEDFEDTELIPGVLIQYDNQSTPTESVQAEDLSTNYPEATWNGDTVFVPVVRDGNAYFDLSFSFNYSVTSIGMGIGDVESPVELLINEVNYGDIRLLSNYIQNDDNQREIYIRIDTNPGSYIESIKLRPVNTGMPFGDGLLIDHLAVQAAQCIGDVNRDGELDFFDVSTFINAFQAGCP